MTSEPCAACGSRNPARRWTWTDPITEEVFVRRLCPACKHDSGDFDAWELYD